MSVRALQAALGCIAALFVAYVARHTALLTVEQGIRGALRRACVTAFPCKGTLLSCPAIQTNPHHPHTHTKTALWRKLIFPYCNCTLLYLCSCGSTSRCAVQLCGVFGSGNRRSFDKHFQLSRCKLCPRLVGGQRFSHDNRHAIIRRRHLRKIDHHVFI